jgi:hypothetical protein
MRSLSGGRRAVDLNLAVSLEELASAPSAAPPAFTLASKSFPKVSRGTKQKQNAW